MPKTVPVQDNFSAGEITPRFIAQLNNEAYKNGVGYLENFVPMSHGPVYRRGGTEYRGQVPGTFGRIFPFPITSSFVLFAVITDLGKIYVASPDEFLVDNNVVQNSNFLTGSTNWTDGSVSTGYVTYSTGLATLVPGRVAGLRRYAEIQQNITLLSGVNDHIAKVDCDPSGGLSGMLIKIGTTAGGEEIARLIVDGSVIDPEFTFDPYGSTNIWISIQALENDDGLTRPITHVQVYDPSASNLIEFTAPWGPDELQDIQVGYPPGEDTMYFASPTDPLQELTFDRATETFSFAAATIGGSSPPSEWVTGNYPRAITFYQGRLWLGGTPAEPETFWASKSGNYLNFDTGSGAADGLSFTMANKGAIRWLVGTKNLLIGTEFGEYICTSEGGVIIPGDIQVEQQSAYGSAAIQPVQIGARVLYVSPDRRKIRDIGYKWTEDGWVSRDITWSSEHITSGNLINELVFAQNPGGLLFACTRGQEFFGGVYERGNDIVGWFRGSTQGKVASIASVDLEGTSILGMLVNRETLNSTLFLEISYPTPTGGFCTLDCRHTFGGDPGGLDINSVTAPALRNSEVNVIVDGAIHPNVTLNMSGEADLQFGGKQICVGLAYDATLETLPLASTLQIGQSTLPMQKRFNKIFVRIFDSTFPLINGARPPVRHPSSPMDEREENFTGDIQIVNLGWDKQSKITVSQDLPLPTQIAGIFGEAAQEMIG